MKKPGKSLRKGDKIKIAGKICQIIGIELSDIGKHGKRKCRIEAQAEKGERLVIIRPEDYPFEILK